MKLCFLNASSLIDGIALVAPDLDFTLVPESEADLVISVSGQAQNGFTLSLSGCRAAISFSSRARFFRALCTLLDRVRSGETEFTHAETPLFITTGAMVDMSRNAVMNVDTVCFMLRKMALMGLNTFMLYTEDTYEVENRPYFGHMRGRYTREEIREMDEYAQKLGIELIPCIQLLGHLARALRWNAAAPYKDTANALLVGAEETYAFIDDLLASVAASFSSRRLHMGMDETHDLGTGQSLDKNSYTPRKELYFAHLAKVVSLAKKHGFTPMMWSDMFFRMSAAEIKDFRDYDPRTVLPADIRKYVPEGVQQVFWDYYNPDETFYAFNLDKHDQLGDHTLFAGGIWTWSGHCPHYSRSIRNSIPALNACRKKGTQEIFATIWHNGSESCLVMSLPLLAMYADYDYTGHYDENSVRACFRASCGLSYDDFMLIEQPEYPHGDNYHTGLSRALLYNDPLLGLVDAQIAPLNTLGYYQALTQRMNGVSCGKKEFEPAFEVIRLLTALLENKADFGVRLKAAYDEKNLAALAALYSETETIIEKIHALRKAHRTAWMKYNKSFGWEVHDIRYGGLIMRFDTVRDVLLDYLAGNITKIDELEQPRLRFDCREDGQPFGGNFLWNQYPLFVTAGGL